MFYSNFSIVNKGSFYFPIFKQDHFMFALGKFRFLIYGPTRNPKKISLWVYLSLIGLINMSLILEVEVMVSMINQSSTNKPNHVHNPSPMSSYDVLAIFFYTSSFVPQAQPKTVPQLAIILAWNVVFRLQVEPTTIPR